MSGAFPLTPKFSRAQLKSTFNNASDLSQSRKKFSRSFGGHLWGIDLEFPPMTQAQFMPLWAFVQAQEGTLETFTIRLPDKDTPLGEAGGTPLVNGASQTGKALIVDGGTANQTAWLKAGDVFLVAGSPKVYAMTADADTGASGAVTLNFVPTLVVSPADNAALTIVNVPFTVSFVEDDPLYGVTPPYIYDFSIKLIESL